MQFTLHSFDRRGFIFSLILFSVLGTFFAAVRYGTALASEYIVASSQSELTNAELAYRAYIQARPVAPSGPQAALAELTKYEETLSTRTIGTASIDTLAQTHESFIAADLTAMKLYLFENGAATTTFNILSKGKRGSRWETPTGLYKIETREENHFSSIGEVNMPYSMQFFGNFFVHGWPTYLSGEPVPEGYSGGCIRLSTEDAAEVYSFARRGTPIFVWEEDATSTPSFAVNAPLPTVSARAWLVADIDTGNVYGEGNAEIAYPIASISKLLTALVANETIHFDRTITVTADDRGQTEGSPGTIRSGETFTVGELLYPLLMESNNSAAYSLARYNGVDNFMRWVNDKAKAIGMTSTTMEDPSGLSEKNMSSADDLFTLLRYINRSQSFILNLTREPQKTLKAENGRTYTFGNFNHFTGDGTFIGGKVGYTDAAQHTFASIFEIPVGDTVATIAIIVLQSKDDEEDARTLRNWFARNAQIME